MARFAGNVGYTLPAVETPPNSGIWEASTFEVAYRGDVVSNLRQLSVEEKINGDISVGNTISIVADAYANQHFAYMVYIKWMGVRWIISTVVVQPPRLILTLGEMYNGPTP